MANTPPREWLLIFYSVPSHPVSNRMKIWRKLARSGAVQLKGAVYMLPHNEEHYELCEWLVSEVASMGGDGTFVRVAEVETMTESDIIALFNGQRENDYRNLEKKLEELERKISNVRKGGRAQKRTKLSEQLNRDKREFEDIRKVDFFASKTGEVLLKRIKTMEYEVKGMSSLPIKEQTAAITQKRITDYKGKTWVTRKKPFVDRMASAWLVKRFLDPGATFRFIEEKELGSLDEQFTTFDIRGAEFTHQGDLCTFEVLIKSFGIKDKAVRRIAEVVHDLDIKDEKYNNPETSGVEEILTGIRKADNTDETTLEKGMAVFDMLYVSKT
jgi:hypothetical protein